MARARASMRKIRDVLRLRWLVSLSYRQIGRSVGLGRGTVGDYVLRAQAAGLDWEQAQQMDDAQLEDRLFPSRKCPLSGRHVPDWNTVHEELGRKSVTLALLWQEYRESHTDGYGYSRYCELYRQFAGTLDVWLRQEHKAGQTLFVDYAGQTVPISNRRTGEVRAAQIYVAVLGASNYTYAEATWTQALEDWIPAHVRAFEFFDGVTEVVTPDNLKSGVKKPCRYEPEANPSYAEMARHYGVAVIPGRIKKPRDKAKAEAGVLFVERWILARLRNQKFFTLHQLNRTIRKLLEELNARPLKVLKKSRRELYEQLDRPALRPLPEQQYVLADWKKVKPGCDYHVQYEGHFYSVPYQLIKKKLDLRATARTVEIFHRSKRVAAHRRSRALGKHTTVLEHMPKAHREHVEWTPVRLVKWAKKTGEQTAQLVETILESRVHPQQGFRSCLGLMRLGEKYSSGRLEAACGRALRIETFSYQSVKSILRTGLDQQPLAEEATEQPSIEHDNVRGADYYAKAAAPGEAQPC